MSRRFPELLDLVEWATQTFAQVAIQQYMGRLPSGEMDYIIHEIKCCVREYEDDLRRPRVVPNRTAQSMLMPQYPTSLPKAPNKIPKENSFGEITAFRVWRVTSAGLLRSTYKDTIWNPKEVLKSHVKPGDRSADGIHGWKSLFEAINYAQELNSSSKIAVGRVHLWGDVVEHKRGYRAEYAKIIGIDDLIGEISIYEGVYDFRTDQIVQKYANEWNAEKLQKLQDTYFPEQALKRQERMKNAK